MEREWKVIPGYSRYKASNDGAIWDTKRDVEVGQFLSGIPQYYYVNVFNDEHKRHQRRVHNLMARAFLGEPEEGFDVCDHIDRDKFNNVITNLRWVDHSGNMKNKDNTIFVGDITLTEHCDRYENPTAAYSFIYARTANGMTLEESILDYEIHLDVGQKRFKVVWKGSEIYLKLLCENLDLDYKSIHGKLSTGYDIWEAVYNCPPAIKYLNSFEVPDRRGCIHWYESKSAFHKAHNFSKDRLETALKYSEYFLEDIINFKYDHSLYARIHTVSGVTGTVRYLREHFGITESSLTARMSKGMSLEEALTKPPEKIKLLKISGVVKTPKAWCDIFGINNKTLNKKRKDNNWSFKQAFEYFGVDTSGMVFDE